MCRSRQKNQLRPRLLRSAAATLLLGSTIMAGPSFAQDTILVPSQGNLAWALDTVSDGGVILIAPGTYSSPTGGWTIPNPDRHFTVRGDGAGAVLSGSGNRPVLRILVDNPARQGWVTFENLRFSGGLSLTDGTAGGVTLNQARATFIDCAFSGNVSDAPTTGGGGVGLANQSEAVFIDCEWSGNSASNGGGAMRLGGDSVAFVHRSQVVGNRSNLAGHRPTSTAGGFDVNDSFLWVTNTRFDSNQSGFAGGGIFTIGTWLPPYASPRAGVTAANCTFIDNEAVPNPGVTSPSPTEGGAIHAEDQSSLRVFNSRFSKNLADLGGAISIYRSGAVVDDSVFVANQAVGVGTSTGFGGAIKITSDDGPEDGSTNYPPASLSLTDSFVQGDDPGVTTVGQVAGGVFASGDMRRNYGLSGSQVIGTPADNRAVVTIDNVVFHDLDVDRGGVAGQGLGGAISVALTALELSDSLVIGCDAVGSPTSGGAMRIVFESTADVTGTTLAGNSATQYGGAVFAQATDIDFTGCQLFDNELSPGVVEPENNSYGAAIFAAPLQGWAPGISPIDFPVTGRVGGSTFSNNVGMPIFDDDRVPSPINAVRYNNNQIYNTTFGSRVYRHSTQLSKTAAELNSLVIPHSGVDKGTGNSGLSSAPVLGSLLAVPPQVLDRTAAGDPPGSTESYLAYAYDGGNATLDGAPLSGGYGWQTASVGTHNLWVQSTRFQATVAAGPTPAASLSASPAVVTAGQPVTLSWSVSAGDFERGFIDNGVGAISTTSGQVVVTPTASTEFTLYVATRQGGATATASVCVNCDSPLFSDGFESGDVSRWSFAFPD